VSDQTTQQRTPEEIRADIAETREELADTAAALAHKADVKGRAKERVAEIKGTVKDKAPDSAGGAAQSVTTTVKQNPLPTAAIAAAVLGFAIGYLLAKRADTY
jgi:ElaB/YqjD/DUF883 family membrane-anchored ribosome-binding protein